MIVEVIYEFVGQPTLFSRCLDLKDDIHKMGMPNGCVCLLIVVGVLVEVGGIDGIVGWGRVWCMKGMDANIATACKSICVCVFFKFKFLII